MDTSVIVGIIGSMSALLGASLGAVFQRSLARENREFQFRLESDKRRFEVEEQEYKAQKQRLLDVHKAISRIARDFSITALDILWRKGMTDKEYDRQYMECCEALDEVRATCDLYIPEVSDHIENMHGQMNLFWGSFKEILRLTELGEPYEKKEHFHSEAIGAAQNIGSIASAAKGRLGSLIGKYYRPAD